MDLLWLLSLSGTYLMFTRQFKVINVAIMVLSTIGIFGFKHLSQKYGLKAQKYNHWRMEAERLNAKYDPIPDSVVTDLINQLDE